MKNLITKTLNNAVLNKLFEIIFNNMFVSMIKIIQIEINL